MPRQSLETDIECPQCGAMAPVEVTRCPECGQSFFPDDEIDPAVSKKRVSTGPGLLQRVITLVLVGGFVGGGLSLLMGPAWVWLVLVGALVFGALGWLWDRQN